MPKIAATSSLLFCFIDRAWTVMTHPAVAIVLYVHFLTSVEHLHMIDRSCAYTCESYVLMKIRHLSKVAQ